MKIKKNSILYFFTKEYQDECKYTELKKSMRGKVKLKCGDTESIDDKVKRLILSKK